MMDRIVKEHARLIVLRALAGEVNGSLNSGALADHLQVFGIGKPRHWLHAELRWLEEAGALTLTDAGTVKVASITQRGLDHVERRTAIEGVKRPSPQEG